MATTTIDVLLLGDDADPSLAWLSAALAEHPGLAVVRLGCAELATQTRVAHEVSDDGATTRLSCASSGVIDLAQVGVVVNRFAVVPPELLVPVEEADREYAANEWYALLTSILSAIDAPVLNPPSARGLCGAGRPQLEWGLLAHTAGLRWDDSVGGLSRHRAVAFVVGRRAVLGEAPSQLGTALVRLAELARTPLLGVELCGEQGDWVVVSASALPDLRAGGQPLVDAIAATAKGGMK